MLSWGKLLLMAHSGYRASKLPYKVVEHAFKKVVDRPRSEAEFSMQAAPMHGNGLVPPAVVNSDLNCSLFSCLRPNAKCTTHHKLLCV